MRTDTATATDISFLCEDVKKDGTETISHESPAISLKQVVGPDQVKGPLEHHLTCLKAQEGCGRSALPKLALKV